MAQYKKQLEQKREKLGRLARVGLSKGGKTLPESKASTRYSEIENVDVLLIRSKKNMADSVHLRLLDDSLLTLTKGIRFRNRKAWRKCAAVIQKNTVSVPEWIAPEFIRNELEFLKDFVYLGDEDEHPFRAAIVRDSGELVGIGQQDSSVTYRLRYSKELGYLAGKRGN